MDQMRTAWLALVAAEALVSAEVVDLTDEAGFAAAQLLQAQLFLEDAADGFGPIDPGEEPRGTASELIRAAVAALCAVPADQEPPQLTLALLAATDALRSIQKRTASC